MNSTSKYESEQHDAVAHPVELQSLHAEMEELIAYHQDVLKNIGVLKDAEQVITWISRCEEGSLKAERKLYQDGIKILENIRIQLHIALEEQQHFDESPNPITYVNSRDRREIEHYAMAYRRSDYAVSTLMHLTETAKHSSL